MWRPPRLPLAITTITPGRTDVVTGLCITTTATTTVAQTAALLASPKSRRPPRRP